MKRTRIALLTGTATILLVTFVCVSTHAERLTAEGGNAVNWTVGAIVCIALLLLCMAFCFPTITSIRSKENNQWGIDE